MNNSNPTPETYGPLAEAYDHFNRCLFGGALPNCLITMQRRRGAYGYFSGSRFVTRAGDRVSDEIALNPSYFRERTTVQILSTLGHEMSHLWQHHFGKPSRGRYHNREWANRMRAIGLIPSDTGAVGGKETGQSVSHYIEVSGPFDCACRELIERGFTVLFVEVELAQPLTGTLTGKAASKGKYRCPDSHAQVWGKPNLYIICGICKRRMLPTENGRGLCNPSDIPAF